METISKIQICSSHHCHHSIFVNHASQPSNGFGHVFLVQNWPAPTLSHENQKFRNQSCFAVRKIEHCLICLDFDGASVDMVWSRPLSLGELAHLRNSICFRLRFPSHYVVLLFLLAKWPTSYFIRRVQEFLQETVFLKGLIVERGSWENPIICRLRSGNVTLKHG